MMRGGKRWAGVTKRGLMLLLFMGALACWWIAMMHTVVTPGGGETRVPLHVSSSASVPGASVLVAATANGQPTHNNDIASSTYTTHQHNTAVELFPVPQKLVCNEKLYTPTYVTFIEELGLYSIVDCWHHRTIVAPSLESPISEWKDLRETVSLESLSSARMTHQPTASKLQSLNALKIPHSLATNGKILVTESSVGGSNGDNHSVLVFRYVTDSMPTISEGGSTLTKQRQRLVFHSEVLGCDNNRARRPHRIIYDRVTDSFFLYMTSPAHLARFVWNDATQELERKSCQGLPFMRGMYARSILALNGSLYITAGPGVISECTLDRSSGLMVRKASYATKFLGFQKGKMNDLAYFDGWWYATSTVPCSMVRFRDIHRIWEHEKIHAKLGLCSGFSRREKRCLGGTPYFVSKIGDRIYVPYIFGCSGMVSFRVDSVSGSIEDVQQHWGGGWVEDEADLSCRGSEW